MAKIATLNMVQRKNVIGIAIEAKIKTTNAISEIHVHRQIELSMILTSSNLKYQFTTSRSKEHHDSLLSHSSPLTPRSPTRTFHSSLFPFNSGAYIPYATVGRALNWPGISARRR